MDMAKYIGEATAYDKKLMLERKEPLSWLKSVSAFANAEIDRAVVGGILVSTIVSLYFMPALCAWRKP